MIISLREKKAKKISFNSDTTIIKGTNQVGKSSLIKSIYYTLGATPGLMHPNWIKSEPISLLNFEVDNKSYQVLRFDKKRFIVIDHIKNVMYFTFKEFSAYLNRVLDFQLIINNRSGEPETPPPAYLFLPFYIDQDKSWSKNWDSFSNLSQFSNWKKPLINYHTGIKGNAYYITKSELDKTKQELDETSKEIDALNKILKNLNKKLTEVNLSITVDDFNNEITQLLSECESLKIEQNKIKQKLVELYNEKIAIESKITIVERSIKETKKDYKYALEKLDNDIDCPTCGAHYKNNFAERFSIAEDQDSLEELYDELRLDLIKVKDKIEDSNNMFSEIKADYEKIQEVLNKKQSNVKLMDVIENEGKKRVKEIFEQEQSSIFLQIGKAQKKRKELEEKLKIIDKKGKIQKDNIMSMYRTNFSSNLKKLNINIEKFSQSSFKQMDTVIKETGSALPRGLLAYYFTLFDIMNKYSTSTFCPIIIDSPNQQEQDKKNLDAILTFIKENKPKNAQLILGLVDDNENTYRLNKKDSLLRKKDYVEVYNEIKPLIENSVFGESQITFL